MDERPWEAAYPEGVEWGAPLPLRTLPDYLRSAAERWPKQTALSFEGQDLSYEQLWRLATIAAGVVRSAGLGRGDNLAVFLPNGPHHIAWCFGAFLAGVSVVNLSTEAPSRSVILQLEDTGAKLLITVSTGPLNDKAREVLESTPQVKVLWCDPDEPLDGRAAPNTHEPTIVRLSETDPPKENPTNWGLTDLEGVALIQFTGGTTGFPKGAMLLHSNVSAAVEMTRRWFEPALVENGRLASLSLPLSHIFGFWTLMLCMATGTPIRLHRRFDPFAAAKEINREQITLYFGVPTMYAAMLATGLLTPEGTASLGLCIAGGAPLTPELGEAFWEATRRRLHEGYGMSETASCIVGQPLSEPKAGATGLPLPGTTIEIVDLETGETLLELGRAGEVCVTGPQVMAGYWNRPEETAAAFRGGRLHTGDIGLIEPDGYLRLIDRKKDMILTGGFNVFPSVVEAALREHPAIAEAAVVGVRDTILGQVLKAFLRARPGAEPCGSQNLTAFLALRLASYEIPISFEWRDELPKTAVGKPARNLLQRE